jgi:hypothetical protein
MPDFPSPLPPADLRGAFLDAAINLSITVLSSPDASTWQHTGPHLGEVHWGGAKLIVTDWESVAMLADEHVAAHGIRRRGPRRQDSLPEARHQPDDLAPGEPGAAARSAVPGRRVRMRAGA